MLQRNFFLGTEWLYFKIYTGIKTSDLILQQSLIPLLKFLLEDKIIYNWFFIRYSDPENHLRLRILLSDEQNFTFVLNYVNQSLEVYLDSGEISNIVIDTYAREIERYGENTIEYVEKLFFKSSELICNFLQYNDEEKIIVSMFYVERLLCAVNLSDNEKLSWITTSDTDFKKEISADKKLNSQLDKKYRSFKPKYIEFMHSEEFIEIRSLIEVNISECSGYFGEIVHFRECILGRNFLIELFQSILHMHINRTFISEQRVFELVIYDFLKRYYKSLSYLK